MTIWERKRYEDAKLAYAALMMFYPLTSNDLDGEQWKDITGYEGFYQISTFGRVKRLWRSKTRILKPFVNKGGYLCVILCKENRHKTLTVHRLVAIHFVSNPEDNPQVDHRWGIKLDNYFENLRWVTSAQNIQAAWEMGLSKTARGGDDSQAKLTNEQADYARRNPDRLTRKQLGAMFGVNYRTIAHIQRGETYKLK